MENQEQANISLSHFLNSQTRDNLGKIIEGYIKKNSLCPAGINRHGLIEKDQEIIRMDLGQNPDGCAPVIREYLQEKLLEKDFFENLMMNGISLNLF